MSVFEKIISIIAPFSCFGCGASGKLVCGACAEQTFDPILPQCVLCEQLSPSFTVCVECANKTHLSACYTPFRYDDLAAKLVWALKFERAMAAAAEIAWHLHLSLPKTDWDLVTHVPTTNKRARQRGYDQAALIAKEFAKLRGISYSRLLFRAKDARQFGRGRAERLNQLDGAFEPARRPLNQHVLVVDDVMATGSSVMHCAEVIKLAGARKVDAAVFARSVNSALDK